MGLTASVRTPVAPNMAKPPTPSAYPAVPLPANSDCAPPTWLTRSTRLPHADAATRPPNSSAAIANGLLGSSPPDVSVVVTPLGVTRRTLLADCSITASAPAALLHAMERG